MSVRILHGDCRTILPALEADSFDCIVTSPPYWGLRDYGVDGQIGLEPTLGAYVEEMAALGDALWRVLKPEGTFWLNLGDSYSSVQSNGGQHDFSSSGLKRDGRSEESRIRTLTINAKELSRSQPCRKIDSGLKPKDLCGVPWRVAFAMQARGWWLRSAIIWAKPNPMPESVTDRPTSAYEMVFLLTKAERYFYDADAIAESCAESTISQHGGKPASGVGPRSLDTSPPGHPTQSHPDKHHNGRGLGNGAARDLSSRNSRNVWTIATQPYRGSHFATMPPDLAERCIKAGCPKGGHVLDPFGGAGTTGLVADRLGRDATLIELNPTYADLGRERIRDDAPLFVEAAE